MFADGGNLGSANIDGGIVLGDVLVMRTSDLLMVSGVIGGDIVAEDTASIVN
jgi:hypothetical protein